ncbi:MAG: hypothetical protein E7288_04085 [Lachnospiraceae bacterium]|nr:hypothetical protein [Lachnospiraceae bacterium]
MANTNKNNKNSKQYLIIGIIALVLVVLSGGSITAASVFDFFGMEDANYEVTQDMAWQEDDVVRPDYDDAQTGETEDGFEADVTEEAYEEEPAVTNEETVSEETAATEEVSEAQEASEAKPVEIRYKFRKKAYLDQHYEKHGIEMGFASAQEYLEAANAMIAHPDVLTKKEKEDNDDVYFLEATGEFAVVSTDGYLRTYYLADKDYFERQ